MKKLLFAFAAVALLISACKEDEKEDENPKPTPTQGEINLSEKDWRMIAQFTVYTKGTKDSTHNDFADMEECEQDDLVRFNSSKIVTSKVGVLKCDPSEPASVDAGTWALSADNKKLTVTVLGIPIESAIQELTATNLTTVDTETDSDFDAIKTTSVFVKN